MASHMTRREFVQHSLAAGLTLAAPVALAAPLAGKAEAEPAAPPAGAAPAAAAADAPQVPGGTLGTLPVSRLWLGGNLLTRSNHSYGLAYVNDLMTRYLSDEKIVETLEAAERHGIDTLSMSYIPQYMDLLKRHRANGGRLKWVLNLMVSPDPDLQAFRDEVTKAVFDGADAVFVHGVHADGLLAAGKVDLIAQAVRIIQDAGVPAGVAAHDLNVIIECEKQAIACDFYVKTFHHHRYAGAPRPEQLKGATCEVPGYWCLDPAQTIDVMSRIQKPWVAYKVMAAGAIAPHDAFSYVFEQGADFVLAGMFDFQVAENARIAAEVLSGLTARSRPWRG